MGADKVNIITNSTAKFQAWLADSDHINQIRIHCWTDFPDPDISGEFYPVFELAYAYLVDTQHGHGVNIADMRRLFQFMATGNGFGEAFSNALGMEVSWYQENFYGLMAQYFSNFTSESVLSLKDKMDFPKDVREK